MDNSFFNERNVAFPHTTNDLANALNVYPAKLPYYFSKYESDLTGHIQKSNGKYLLDDFAYNFLFEKLSEIFTKKAKSSDSTTNNDPLSLLKEVYEKRLEEKEAYYQDLLEKKENHYNQILSEKESRYEDVINVLNAEKESLLQLHNDLQQNFNTQQALMAMERQKLDSERETHANDLILLQQEREHSMALQSQLDEKKKHRFLGLFKK